MKSPCPLYNANQHHPIARCGFDDFEVGLLACLRHFLTSFAAPETHAWRMAYRIAGERWGETIGFAAAQAVLKVASAVLEVRQDGLSFNDPLAVEQREYVTDDEHMLIAMLHHMRRDDTAQARVAVDTLTHGRMDPFVIRAGLSLARRFPKGHNAMALASRPDLRVIG